MTMFTFEILCIGNELLSGTTVNTNAQWLSQKITESGGCVMRITIVRDDIDEIALVIKESLVRKPRWLIISGGLGPTYDDKTLQGVGMSLGVQLALDKRAVEMLRKSYSRHLVNYDELNEIRLKMATIPIGSIPIQNPVGTAPSVIIETAGTKIICLPGVPKEMEAIFLESILPQIKKIIGDFHIAESSYEIVGVTEAMLAPILNKIVESNLPDSIYLKTHPRGHTSDNKPMLRVQIVSRGKNKSEAETRYNNISSMMVEEIHRLGGTIL
jgi:molybdenum cofactor synthesis domain-containing protein